MSGTSKQNNPGKKQTNKTTTTKLLLILSTTTMHSKVQEPRKHNTTYLQHSPVTPLVVPWENRKVLLEEGRGKKKDNNKHHNVHGFRGTEATMCMASGETRPQCAWL